MGGSNVEMQQQQQRESGKRRRFKPWMNWRRMFQRKAPADDAGSGAAPPTPTPPKGRSSRSAKMGVALAAASRSRSIGELLSSPGTESQPIPLSGADASGASGSSGGGDGLLGAGLSVSHDSVFGLDASPSDAHPARHQRHHHHQDALPSPASLQYMSELRAAIGVRRRSTDEDEGFPRSPLNVSPTTTQVLSSTCFSLHHSPVRGGSGSDPSLLSINSCELEEAPFASLQTRSVQQQPEPTPAPQQAQQVPLERTGSGSPDGGATHGGGDDGFGLPPVALNHSAARHKIAIRPKRNHAPGRVRQLPQLAEDSGIGGDLTDASWSAGAFEVGPDRRHRAVEQSHNLHAKPRSVSLSRTEDTAAKEAAVHGGPDAGCKPSAGSSTTKLARSKSSVEKKIQHEVAVFWRKTKEGRLFHRKENNHDKDVSLSQESCGPAPAASEPEMKRKDLRKIKRDKEEKRKRSEAGSAKEEPSPPFLSRIFGSRRSGRRLNKKLAAQPPASLQVRCDEARTEPPLPAAFTAQVEPAHPAPKPRTVFLAPGDVDDDSEMEVDWRVPPQPYSFAPPPSRVLPPVRQQEEWVEDRPDQLCSSAPLASPRLGQRGEELRAQPSPLPARHRIHIAGLSPYQRRVARIGNGLEISDEEWDDIGADASPPARLGRYEPDGQNQSDLSLDVDNNSHAMSVNHDFILKRATANHQDAELGVSEHMRRSFDILKFSNEGLKKTIDSLNNQRMSQSSDQLHLSDSSVRRESTGSMSNSTSSLNISDADDLADLDGSGVSLDRSSGCEKDVRDDVLIIDDHKETIDATVWPAECRVQPPPGPTKAGSLSPASKSGADSPTDKSRAASLGAKSGSSSPVSKTNGKSPPASPVSEAPSSQGVPEFLQVHLQPVQQDADERCEDAKLKARATWEPRQLTDPTETPMFSMSVRVQNPPDAKFRRSPSSGEACHPSLPPENPVAASRPADDQQQQPPRPFIASVRMRTEEDGAHPAAVAAAAATSHHLMARLSARPWQSKEDKERQNKVLLDRSQAETTPPDGSADNAADVVEMPPEVKLRPKKPAGAEETSELLKVFARRSLKLRDSRDLTDAGAVADQHPSAPDAHAKSDAFGSIPRQLDADAERHDPPKERASSRWQSKPPVAARASLDNPPHPSERKLKRPSKSVPLVRHHDPHASLDHADQKSSLLSIKQSPSLLICREPPSGASSPASSDSSPTGAPAPPAKFFEPDDRVRPEAADAVWKKQPRFGDRFANSQPAKSNVEDVKASPGTPAVRQSKVLDMVHNFQRLQVT